MYTAVQSSKKKHIYASLLGFVFSILLLGILLILGLYMGMFRTSFIMEQWSNSQDSEKSYELFQTRTKNYCEKIGIPFPVVEKTYSKKRFLIQQRKVAANAIKGENQTSNQEPLQEELNNTLIAYLQEKNIPTSKTIENGLWEVTSKIEEFYQEGIQVRFLTDLGNYKKEITKKVVFLFPCLVVLSILIFLILLHIFQHKEKSLGYLAVSVLSTMIMLMTILTIAYQTIDYSGYVAQSVSYKEFIEQYTKGSLNALFYSAGIGFVLFLGFLILIQFIKKNGDRWERQ